MSSTTAMEIMTKKLMWGDKQISIWVIWRNRQSDTFKRNFPKCISNEPKILPIWFDYIVLSSFSHWFYFRVHFSLVNDTLSELENFLLLAFFHCLLLQWKSTSHSKWTSVETKLVRFPLFRRTQREHRKNYWISFARKSLIIQLFIFSVSNRRRRRNILQTTQQFCTLKTMKFTKSDKMVYPIHNKWLFSDSFFFSLRHNFNFRIKRNAFSFNFSPKPKMNYFPSFNSFRLIEKKRSSETNNKTRKK